MADISVKIGDLKFNTPVLTGAGPNVRDHRIINKVMKTRVGGVVSKTFSMRAAEYPKPAMFNTVCGGMINCETWLEKSTEECITDYEKVDRGNAPFIVSIGYSIDDMRKLGPMIQERLKPDAIEFSTHYQDQSVEDLVSIAAALRESVSIPIWMKLSPDQPFLESIVSKAEKFVDGFVAVNSLGPALDFNIDKGKPGLGSDEGYGWLSGPPLLPVALQTVHRISTVTDKPIIGVGGISCGEDAIKFLMVGASAVQVCTKAILKGPKTYENIANEMEQWLDEKGYESVEQVKNLYRHAVMDRKGLTRNK